MKKIETRIINGKEVELTTKISNESIATEMRFEIDGVSQCLLRSTARVPASSGGRFRMKLTPSVCEFFEMMKRHDRVHQEIVEDIRSSDALAAVRGSDKSH